MSELRRAVCRLLFRQLMASIDAAIIVIVVKVSSIAVDGTTRTTPDLQDYHPALFVAFHFLFAAVGFVVSSVLSSFCV